MDTHIYKTRFHAMQEKEYSAQNSIEPMAAIFQTIVLHWIKRNRSNDVFNGNYLYHRTRIYIYYISIRRKSDVWIKSTFSIDLREFHFKTFITHLIGYGIGYVRTYIVPIPMIAG